MRFLSAQGLNFFGAEMQVTHEHFDHPQLVFDRRVFEGIDGSRYGGAAADALPELLPGHFELEAQDVAKSSCANGLLPAVRDVGVQDASV